MELRVIGTGSSGNCYLLLPSDGAGIVIDFGVNTKQLLKEVNHDISQIKFGLLTHEHGDHAGFLQGFLDLGIPVFMSEGTKNKAAKHNHFAVIAKARIPLVYGNWKVVPFNVNHDAAEPFGFVIEHHEMGRALFVTDAIKVPIAMEYFDHIIIEANYNESVINRIPQFLKDRVILNHMSFETALEYVKNQNLKELKSLTFIHLSNGNSIQSVIEQETINQLGITPNVATNGYRYSLNKNPF